jgi:hypothetical protein
MNARHPRSQPASANTLSPLSKLRRLGHKRLQALQLFTAGYTGYAPEQSRLSSPAIPLPAVLAAAGQLRVAFMAAVGMELYAHLLMLVLLGEHLLELVIL